MYGVRNINKIGNYYEDEKIFPKSGMVLEVEDGDTFRLDSGQVVRMIGVNAPDRGKDGYETAKDGLRKITEKQKIWLEYDRYQDDKYGRILAWVWVDCETDMVKMPPADYMHLSGKQSREYVTTNPNGCSKGKMVNREMVKNGNAEMVSYEKRGRLKYELISENE